MSTIDVFLYAASGIIACFALVTWGWVLHSIIVEQRHAAYKRGYSDARNDYSRFHDQRRLR